MAAAAAASGGSEVAAWGAGRGALITGGSSGLGLEMVKDFLAAGFSVVTTARDVRRLTAAFDGVDTAGRLHFLAVDLTDGAAAAGLVDRAVELLPGGRLDVVVNNAGGGLIGQQFGAAESAPGAKAAAYDAVFNLDVKAVFLITDAAVRHLTPTRGIIINLSSVAGQRPMGGLAPYCAAKAAVDMLTKTAALELAGRGIRVNAIAPATVETDFHRAAGMTEAFAKAYYAASCATHPIGRVGRPHDISAMALFLADESKSGFMTGSIVVIDGGRLLTASTAPQLAAPFAAPTPAPAAT